MTLVSAPIRTVALIFVSIFLASGCATTQKPSGEASAAGTLTDAQIAAIVVTANQIDIENGELANSKSENPEVKKFAQRMMEDHRSVNQAASELVTRLGVTPEETDTSRSLKQGADATREQLSAMSGAEFDKAYVDNEVAYHEAVLGVLDAQLVPSAQNEELKAMLVDVRPAFVAHLEHAKGIQSQLNGAAAGGAGAHSGH